MQIASDSLKSSNDKKYVTHKTRMLRKGNVKYDSNSVNEAVQEEYVPSMSSAGPSLVKSLGVEYISDETNLVNLQSESNEKSVSLNISKGLDAKKSLAIDVPKPQQVSSPGKQYAAQMARKRRQSNLSTSSPLGKVLVATAPPVNAEEVKLNASTVKTSESSVSTGQNITPPEVNVPDGWYSGVGGAMGLTVRVETEMTQKNGIISSVFVRSINQTIFEDREIEGIPCTLEEIDMEACRSIVWQEKLMEGLKGSVVSQIDGLYNTKDNTITLKIWIKIGWMPAVALNAKLKKVEAPVGPY